MLSEISQAAKDKYCMVSLSVESKNKVKQTEQNKNRFIEIENKKMVVRRKGVRRRVKRGRGIYSIILR